MRKPLAFGSLVTVGCLSVIVILSGVYSGRLRVGSPQATQSPGRTPAQPSQVETASLTEPLAKSKTRLGYTSRNTPINAFVFGNGHKHVVVLGGIHGDERSAAVVATALVDSLDNNQVSANLTVVVVPRLNPDGLDAGTRTNGSAVDINRNFPSKTWRAEPRGGRYHSGEKPSSEPETRIVIDLIKKWSPELLISIHAPLNCINWDGPAKDIARTMAEASGYPLREDIGYETPGSLGSYAGKELNIPTITLELQDAVGNQEVTKQGLFALRAAINQIG